MENLETRLNEVGADRRAPRARNRLPSPTDDRPVGDRIGLGRQPVGQANYFGIKRADRHTKCCTVTTREVINGESVIENLEFADYDSLEDSCRDYAWLITQGMPYHAAWDRYQQDHDLNSLIAAVARTYASDPAYARLVTAIAAQNKRRACSRGPECDR